MSATPKGLRENVAQFIGDAKPAADGLLVQLALSVSDIRYHDHPKSGDLYCSNLTSWLGERMGPVLRRLIDAEAEIERLSGNRAEGLPRWEATYEPGNVSDYLIGHTNDEIPAKRAAEAWFRSQCDTPNNTDWIAQPQLAAGQYDVWHELIQIDSDDQMVLDTGIIVRRRVADAAAPSEKDTAPAATSTPLIAHWNRLVMPPIDEDEHTIVACTADDGRPVALFLTAEHRQRLALELADPGGESGKHARREYLRTQIATQGGRWKSGRVRDLYRRFGYAAPNTRTARHDLAALHTEGFLLLHEDKGVRYYTQKGGQR